MTENNQPSKKIQWLFWLILAAFSTFFAEVFSGSDMFPFFHPFGLLVVVPLYGLHILLLAHLVYRTSQPGFSSLVFAGMIFGLYEAYLTKVLWAPPWGGALIAAEIAPVETLVLVFWWHAWFSFIIPLLVTEVLFTGTNQVGAILPGKIGSFLNSWKGLALLVIFGGVFQSINSPSVGRSLLSGVSTTAVLIGLTILWRRFTANQSYSFSELLPDRRQFRWLLIPTALMYLVMGILLRPEAYPGLLGHLVIWILYGLSFALLFYSLSSPKPINTADPTPATPGLSRCSTHRWLMLAALFPLSAVLGELLLAPIAEPMALLFWFGGIAFGLWMFFKALRLTFRKEGVVQHD